MTSSSSPPLYAQPGYRAVDVSLKELTNRVEVQAVEWRDTVMDLIAKVSKLEEKEKTLIADAEKSKVRLIALKENNGKMGKKQKEDAIRIGALEADQTKLIANVTKLHNLNLEYKACIAVAESEHDQLVDIYEQAYNRLQTTQKQLSGIEEEKKQLSNRVSMLEVDHTKVQGVASSLEQEKKDLLKKVEEMEVSLLAKNKEIDNLKQQRIRWSGPSTQLSPAILRDDAGNRNGVDEDNATTETKEDRQRRLGRERKRRYDAKKKQERQELAKLKDGMILSQLKREDCTDMIRGNDDDDNGDDETVIRQSVRRKRLTEEEQLLLSEKRIGSLYKFK